MPSSGQVHILSALIGANYFGPVTRPIIGSNLNNTIHDAIQCVIHAWGPCITLENSFIINGNFFLFTCFTQT